MLRNRSLKFQFVVMGVLVGILLLAMTAGGVLGIERTAASYGKINRETLPITVAISEMRVATKEMILNIVRLCVPGISQVDSDKAVQNLNAFGKVFEAQRQKLSQLSLGDQEKKLLEETAKAWKEMDETQTQVVFQAKSTDAEDRAAAIQTVNGDFKKTYETLFEKIDSLAEQQHKQAEIDAADAEALQARLHLTVIALALGAFVTSLVLLFFFSKRLISRLSALTEQVTTGARVVASASADIAASNQQLAQAAQQQSATIQSSSSSAHEIEKLILQTLESTKTSSDLSRSNAQAARHGKTLVDEMVRAIHEIRETSRRVSGQIEASNQQFAQLVGIIDGISSKTNVINEIVFQTKLLSFNASVEAARAGEHGRGFAIVAHEVGNLAKMSGDASKEISNLLAQSSEKVRTVVDQTRTQVETLVREAEAKIESGTNVAATCSQALDQIVADSEGLSRKLEAITAASREQSQGVTQISQSAAELEATTAQNTSTVISTQESASRLHAQAENLSDSARSLANTVFGAGRTPDHRQAA